MAKIWRTITEEAHWHSCNSQGIASSESWGTDLKTTSSLESVNCKVHYSQNLMLKERDINQNLWSKVIQDIFDCTMNNKGRTPFHFTCAEGTNPSSWINTWPFKKFGAINIKMWCRNNIWLKSSWMLPPTLKICP